MTSTVTPAALVNKNDPPDFTHGNKMAGSNIRETSSPVNTSKRSRFGPSSRPLVWMGIAFLSAIGVAITHHFVYAKYNHRPVEQANLSQKWILNIGTGLAFATKTLFVLAASIAYTQHQWLVTRSNTFQLRQIDIVSGILQNFLGFFQSRLWLKHPLLTLLSVITWLLPIAAIFTPATLTVVLHSESIPRSTTPQRLYYDPVRYANLDNGGRGGARSYRGPSHSTQRIAYASATSGDVLNLQSGKENVSYVLEFMGPALHCVPITNQTVIASVRDLWTESLRYYYGGGNTMSDRWNFAAWIPDSSDPGNFTAQLSYLTSSSSHIDVSSSDAAHLYVMPNTTVVSDTSDTDSDMHYSYDDVLDCALYNASYTAAFNFTPPSQSVTVLSRELMNGVNATTSYAWDDEETHAWYQGHEAQQLCFQSVMEALGRILLGAEAYADENVWTLSTDWAITTVDWTSRDSTIKGLEDLFANITLSLLSSAEFVMNDTLASQNPVDANFFESYNVYAYHPGILWLSYGIAAGSTLLCIGVGLLAMIRNGACYENVFSTFFRFTAHMIESRQNVRPDDDGRAPPPKQVGDARIPAWNMAHRETSKSTIHSNTTETKSSGGDSVPLMQDRHLIRRKPVPSGTWEDHQQKTGSMQD